MALYMGYHPYPSQAPFYHVANQTLKFSTQVFVFVSGMVLFYSYGMRPLHFGSYLLRRVSGTVVPFLLWSVIYTAWHLRGSGLGGSQGTSPGQIIGEMLRGDANYHLYFVFMVVQLYLLYPLLAPVVHRAFRHGWVMALAGAAAVAAFSLFAWQFYAAGLLRDRWLAALGTDFPAVLLRGLLLYTDRNSLFWLVYFLLGGMVGFARRKGVRVRLPAPRFLALAALLCLGLLLAEYWYLLQKGWHFAYVATTIKPLNLLYSLAMAALLLSLSSSLARRPGPWRRVLSRMGRYSFGIYLIHPLVLGAAAELLLRPNRPLHHPLGAVAGTAVVYLGSYILVAMLSRLPFGQLFVGTGVARPGAEAGRRGDPARRPMHPTVAPSPGGRGRGA